MRKALVLLLGAMVYGAPPFAERVKQVIETNARVENGAYQTIAARLAMRRDPEWCSRRLLELLREPTGDMFWMFPVTAIVYLDRGQLTPEARTALRGAWKSYMPYRGDTENHWLLYYSTLYLMAQKYPNEPGESWFTGKSSRENFAEAESYLYHWMNLTVTAGQGEYDCTHYLGVYLLPLSYLAAWAEDPRMRSAAERMLEWIMADFAAETLDGLYVGAHARTDDVQVLEKWNGVSSDLAWILFGTGYPLPGFSYFGFFYCVARAYEPPEVIVRIATDRSRPYTNREMKRTRHRWRFTDVRNGPVYKTTYMTREYAVGSDQGGILQPIQQHRWDVTWALADPRGKRNTIFSLHPNSSVHELQTYFTGMPDFLTEAVVRSKKSYDSPDKFLGGSPYEEVMQDRDTVIALYNIPEGARFPHVNGFFPEDLARFVEHASGWIFAQGGQAYIAYRPLAPYTWATVAGGGRRLVSPHLRNGTILQVAAEGEFTSFEEFQAKIVALPLEVRMAPTPSVRFQSLRGAAMSFTFGQARDFSAWKAFDSPFMESERGSRRLTLRHGALRRVVDLSDLPER